MSSNVAQERFTGRVGFIKLSALDELERLTASSAFQPPWRLALVGIARVPPPISHALSHL